MEICKVTVATLNHEQMVDLLKTSAIVTVTVLPPVDPNTPRQGCTLQSCSYIVGSIDGEYDNVGIGEEMETSSTIRSSGAVQQQSVATHSRRLRYERSVSPPRSSSSSGYGTGSSSRSFTVQGAAALAASAAAAAGAATISAIVASNPEGTLKSTSSGHSSDDPWYDFMPDVLEAELLNGPGISTTSPPPLPSRQGPPPSRLRSGHSCENFTPPVISVHQPSPVGENMKSSRSHDPVFSQDGSPVKNRPSAPSSAYSTPPSNPKPILESPSLVGRMSNYEDLRRLQTSTAGPQETPGSKVRPLNPPDYHHAMQSRLVALKSPEQHHGPNNRKSPSSTYASRSEDELSAGSTNSLSPRSRRRHNNSKNNGAGTLTPSSGSSRNQSPRLFVEAKLKTNANGSVCSGGSGSGGGNGQKRSSTNLQEELLRLISPDTVDEVSADDSSSVIVTHARPANAVLSSANSSVQSADMADLPDSEEMDWSRLVHAAARAIQGAATTMASAQEDVDDDLMDDEVEEPTHDGSDNQDSLTSWIDDVTEKLRLEAEAADSPPGGYANQFFTIFLRLLNRLRN